MDLMIKVYLNPFIKKKIRRKAGQPITVEEKKSGVKKPFLMIFLPYKSAF